MERGINFIVIGACFIATIIALVVFIFYFGDYDTNARIYRIYSKKAIDGITPESLVKYKGINVGSVKDVRFGDEDFENIVFEVAIRKDLKIKKDSVLKVEQSGLLGGNYLNLIQNESSEGFIEKDDEASLTIRAGLMSEALDKFEGIADDLTLFLSNAKNIVSEENTRSLSNLIASLEDSANGINAIINAINAANMDELVKNIENVAQNAKGILSEIDAKMAQGEYDIKSTISPALQSIERVAGRLEGVISEGEILLDNLKANPYDTIFGYRSENEAK